MKNKFLFTILSALVALPMMAEAIVYSPVSDWNLRPKGDGTGYDAKKEANATNNVFEVNHNARFCAVQQYEVANLGYATKMTLSLKGFFGSGGWGTDALAVWAVNGDWTSNMSAANFITLYSATTGMNPGTAGTTVSTYLLRNKQNSQVTLTDSNKECLFVIEGDALTTLKSKAKNGVITLLITNNKETVEANTNTKRQYYSNGHATESLRPTLSVEMADVPAIYNQNSQAGYDNLATAVAEATAGDVLILNEDVTISGSRLEIKKALTIQGATGAEKIICGVAANTLMVLANHNQGDYDVTFKNLTVDGDSVERSTQMFDANNNGRLVFENVKVIKSKYSVATGDVKSNNREVVLRGNNSFATGIYLNMRKRISNDNATHTTPIRVILADDYEEDFAVVMTCANANLYDVVGADGTNWLFYQAQSGSNKELKGRKACKLTVSDARMATLVIGYDAALPTGVQAYTLTNNGSEYIVAEEVFSITANEPVLIVAEADDYTFDCEVGTVLNEQANPTKGCLVGTYEKDPITIAKTIGNNYNYILAKGQNDVVGFYQVLDDDYKIGRNHAYLSCTHNHNASATAMRLVFHKVPTALENAEVAAPAEKFLMNGTLYIRREGRLYTIDGQVVK